VSAQERILTLANASNVREQDIFGVRMFDENGRFVIGFTGDILRIDLMPEELEQIRNGKTISRFEPALDVSKEFRAGFYPKLIAPVTIAIVPIRGQNGKITGAAQYLLDGTRVQRQLNEVEREIRVSAWSFCLVGGLTILAVLTWA